MMSLGALTGSALTKLHASEEIKLQERLMAQRLRNSGLLPRELPFSCLLATALFAAPFIQTAHPLLLGMIFADRLVAQSPRLSVLLGVARRLGETTTSPGVIWRE